MEFDSDEKILLNLLYKKVFSLEHKKHINHCLTQLKRFTMCAINGHKFKHLQFGYNLGRLQELLMSVGSNIRWWKPIEIMVNNEDWKQLNDYIDKIRYFSEIEYEEETLKKGCM